ncbi:MAG: 1-(5-phosphoribosyl)-5-[(5-phosphoribosylamino)methylideneamino]imidazole-4-carboxamide isomerase [Planctomycetota bacterium]
MKATLFDNEHTMQVWPAIDLRGGKCVRLRQGDYDQETIFNDDPVAVARSFANAGAKHLHVVDLDGAREGLPVNLPAVQDIVASVDLEVELGGGVRDEQSIAELFGFGIHRLVVGTSAIKRPEWFREILSEYPGRLVLGIDARDGRVATDGWLETSEVDAVDLAKQFNDEPLAAIVYTDIATDGMMAGPNVPAMAEMQRAVNTSVVASGGVTTAEDVVALRDAGLAACIIGRALYEGTLTIEAALEAAGGRAPSPDPAGLNPATQANQANAGNGPT